MSRLFPWFLNLVYMAVLLVCAPLIFWAAVRTGKYREGFREKLFGLVPRRHGAATCYWIHAVSVGEVNLLATLLRSLRKVHPDWQIVVSTTSRAGFELARQKYPDLTVFYCPLDFSWAARIAMRRVRPTVLVLAELELWPNLILAAKEQGASVAIINGRLSDKSFPGYRRIKPVIARLLAQVDLIAAQNEESAGRFRALGAPAAQVHVTGSLKYDGAQTDRANVQTTALRELVGIAEQDVVFLAGSTQEPEEQVAVNVFRRLAPSFPRLRLVLVPRHPQRFDAVAKLLDATGMPWQRRSLLGPFGSESLRPTSNGDLRGAPSDGDKLSSTAPILLVDTIGELGAWWGTAQIAFVGGSFGKRGGQNMIEPAAYGAAVSFGPNTRNFRDIVAALLAAGAAVVVQDERELELFVRNSLEDPAFSAELGSRAQALVKSQLGATERTVALLEAILPANTGSKPIRSAA